MKYLRHGVAALVIFAVLIGLCVTMYDSLVDDYGVIPQSEAQVDGKNIGEALDNLLILKGLNKSVEVAAKLNPPEGADADIWGAIAAVGVGFLELVFGLVVFPVQITNVIVQFYSIPPKIVAGFILITVVYLIFILISAYNKGDV